MNCCRILLIPLLLVGVGLPLEAATLKGFVRANELTGPPVPNVQVDAIGANATATDDSGKFTLELPARVPGEMVTLSVNKTGHVVVNEVQLRWPLPKDPDAEPLVLLLSKEDVREEMARRFYRLKSFEAIEAAYQNRLRELKELQQATAAEFAKLKTERDQAKAAAEKAAEELARLKLGQSSELYQEAMRLFLAGRVSDALNTLDADRLRQSVEESKQRKSIAEKGLADAIQAYLLRARLLTTQFRFDEAEKMYEEAMSAAPESLDAYFAYAMFNQRLNRHHKALPAYKRCEDLARRSKDEIELARTLNNLGILHSAGNRMEDARKAFEEALKIRRQLAQQNPETYLRALADTLNNLGILYHDQNRVEDARKAYEEALDIYEDFAKKAPDRYGQDVVRVQQLLKDLKD
jgi:tetratricopeptide (TPR) repeat protein